MRHFKVFLMVVLVVYLGVLPVAMAESGETYFDYSNNGQACSCQKAQDSRCSCSRNSDEPTSVCACAGTTYTDAPMMNQIGDDSGFIFTDGNADEADEANAEADQQTSVQASESAGVSDAIQAFGDEPLSYVSNEHVLLLQKCLNLYIRFAAALGDGEGEIPLQPVAENGVFDPATEAVVRAFQSKFGIEEDGVVGVETKERLFTLFAGSGQ